jgi:hypothetical protein
MSNSIDNTSEDDTIREEYDFSQKTAVRGKYYTRLQQGYSVKIHQKDGTITTQTYIPIEGTIKLDPDVQAYFPDAEAVNNALRTLIHLVPAKKG